MVEHSLQRAHEIAQELAAEELWGICKEHMKLLRSGQLKNYGDLQRAYEIAQEWTTEELWGSPKSV